jgi:F420-0:gamma-glutamyl ligase
LNGLPSYIGPAALGLKMGVFLPGSDLVGDIVERAKDCARDGLMDDGDVLCITESVVARVQDNFVTTDEVAEEVKRALGVRAGSTVGVLFPIVSRNRFSLVLEGIAKAVPGGQVIVQLSYPRDEVGNQTINPKHLEKLNLKEDYISSEDLDGCAFVHPVTKVDYVAYYKQIIRDEGATPTVYFSNKATRIAEFKPDGIVVAEVHDRKETKVQLDEVFANSVTLQELCTSGHGWSEWGLLGSNKSAGNRLKLAPRDGDRIVRDIQEKIKEATGKQIEVIIYGDGAYKDPTTGIYELADPQPVFAATCGLQNRMRTGLKYKYLADILHLEGKNEAEIEAVIESKRGDMQPDDSAESEGTTPRQLTDVLASLADLVSGSADAGTPVVLIKGLTSSTK